MVSLLAKATNFWLATSKEDRNEMAGPWGIRTARLPHHGVYFKKKIVVIPWGVERGQWALLEMTDS